MTAVKETQTLLIKLEKNSSHSLTIWKNNVYFSCSLIYLKTDEKHSRTDAASVARIKAELRSKQGPPGSSAASGRRCDITVRSLESGPPSAEREAQGIKATFRRFSRPFERRRSRRLDALHPPGASTTAAAPPVLAGSGSRQVGDVGEEALRPPLLQVDGHEVCTEGGGDGQLVCGHRAFKNHLR